jgi:hypothetical protein
LASEVGRPVFQPVPQAQVRQQLRRPLARGLTLDPGHVHHQLDVFAGRQGTQQIVRLEHKPHAAQPQRRQLAFLQPIDLLPFDPDLPLTGAQQQARHTE